MSPSDRTLQVFWECERKKPFSQAEAERRAVSARKGGEKTMDAYACHWCGNWHLGHKPKDGKIRWDAASRNRARQLWKRTH